MRYKLFFYILLLLIVQPYSFVAAENEGAQNNVHFIVFGHVYTDYNALQQSIIKVNALDPDFVVFLGDTLPNNHKTGWDELFAITKDILAPVYYVPGNHDISDRPEDKSIFIEKVGPLYQEFTIRDKQFILLNTASGLPGTYDLEDEQIDWLYSTFQDNTTSKKIILMHHCLFYEDDTVLCNGRYEKMGSEYSWNREIVPFIKDKVMAVFVGDLGTRQTYFSYQENEVPYYGVGFSKNGLQYPPHFLSVEIVKDDLTVTPIIIRDELSKINSLDYKLNVVSHKERGPVSQYIRNLVKPHLKEFALGFAILSGVLGFILFSLILKWYIRKKNKNL